MALVRSFGNRMPMFGSFLNDFFDDSDSLGGNNNNMPAVNVKETDKEFQLEVSAPGIPKENIDVHVENNMLVISGQHKEEQNEEKENYTRREFRQSSFSRSFTLPENVDADHIKARCNNGIVNISLPKLSQEKVNKKKQINIE